MFFDKTWSERSIVKYHFTKYLKNLTYKYKACLINLLIFYQK